MSEVTKTLEIKYVANLEEPRQALKELQAEAQATVIGIGPATSGGAAFPSGGAPNRAADYAALFDRGGRAPNLFRDDISLRGADLYIPNGQASEADYAALGWRGRAGRLLADEAAGPGAAALVDGGGSMLPPPRGMLSAAGGEEFGALGQPRPAWANLSASRFGTVEGELLNGGWRSRRGSMLMGNGGGGGGGGPSAGPGDDDEDFERDYSAGAGASSRSRGSRMGFMGRFVALEAVNSIAALAAAARESRIQHAMAEGDPEKLAMADLDERNREAEAVPFGVGKLALLMRDPDGSDELSVRKPFEDAKFADANSRTTYELRHQSLQLGRQADADALPLGSRRQVEAHADTLRKDTFEANRVRAGNEETTETARYQKQQADTEAWFTGTPIHWEKGDDGGRAIMAELAQRQADDQAQHFGIEQGIAGRHRADDAAADTIYNADLRNDAYSRQARLDTSRMDRTASLMREYGFGDAAESYELRRKGEIAAAAEQDPDQKAATESANAAAVSADAAVRGRARAFDDSQTSLAVAGYGAAGRGDTFEQQILHQQAANASDLYQQTSWGGRWNSVQRGFAAMGALSDEQGREVSIVDLASQGAADTADDAFHGDTRKWVTDQLYFARQGRLAALGDPGGQQYQREAPGINRDFDANEKAKLKQFDDDTYLSDYRQNEQRDVAGLRAQGRNRSADVQTILDNSDAQAKGFMRRGGPGATDRARTAYQTGESELQAYQRQLQWDASGGQGHAVGGIAPGGIGPGFTSTRPPNQENPQSGLQSVVAAIAKLQAALTGMH